jgi:hypothetical protein
MADPEPTGLVVVMLVSAALMLSPVVAGWVFVLPDCTNTVDDPADAWKVYEPGVIA